MKRLCCSVSAISPLPGFFLRHAGVSVQVALPSTELIHFRKRIGAEGVEQIFRMSVGLHGELALEDCVN